MNNQDELQRAQAKTCEQRFKSIQRYIKAFEQVVLLQRQGLSQAQMAQLLQIGPSLVQEYLAVYEQSNSPESRQRLEDQLQRISQGKSAVKGGL